MGKPCLCSRCGKPIPRGKSFCRKHRKKMLKAVPLDAETRAVARANDPSTSWEAAYSLSSQYLRESQERVYDMLYSLGPSIDWALQSSALSFNMSPSSIRTRRSELVDLGLVVNSGEKKLTRSGRFAIVWEVVE